jgi:hypothetical protein
MGGCLVPASHATDRGGWVGGRLPTHPLVGRPAGCVKGLWSDSQVALPAPKRAHMEVLTGQPLPAALLQSQLNSSEAAVREHALACLARAHAAGLDVTSVVGACTRAYTHSLHYILSVLCCLTSPTRGASLAFRPFSPHRSASCLPRLVTSAELLSGNARRLAVDVLCSAKLSGASAPPPPSIVFGQSVPPPSHRPSTRCLHGQTRSGRHWQPPPSQSSPQR